MNKIKLFLLIVQISLCSTTGQTLKLIPVLGKDNEAMGLLLFQNDTTCIVVKSGPILAFNGYGQVDSSQVYYGWSYTDISGEPSYELRLYDVKTRHEKLIGYGAAVDWIVYDAKDRTFVYSEGDDLFRLSVDFDSHKCHAAVIRRGTWRGLPTILNDSSILSLDPVTGEILTLKK